MQLPAHPGFVQDGRFHRCAYKLDHWYDYDLDGQRNRLSRCAAAAGPFRSAAVSGGAAGIAVFERTGETKNAAICGSFRHGKKEGNSAY